MTIATTILLFVITFCVYFVWSRRKYYAFALKMPGPMGLPLIGIAHKICNIAKPKIAEVILNSADCINKSLVYDPIAKSIGEALLTSKSPTWNTHRKLINPSFNYKVLLTFFPVFNRVVKELCGKFDTYADCGEVNIYDLLLNLGMKSSFDILYVLPKLTSEYKAKTYTAWLGLKPGVYVMDPETAELLLNSPDCINKSFVYSAISDLGGDGIVTSKSPKWNKHRKLLNACFNHKVLVGFVPGFNKTAHGLCGKLDQFVDRGEVNIKELIFREGLKSAIGTIFGTNLDKEEYNNTILDSWLGSIAIIVERATKPWLLSSTIFPLTNLFKTFSDMKTNIDNFIQGMVRSRIDFFENQTPKDLSSPTNSENIEKPRRNILDQSVKIYQNNKFTFLDVVAETGTIVFAAFETTNMAIFSTLLFLAMHPEYQEKLYEEIVTYFPDEKSDVEYEDLKNFVYLDMCINETLRLAPSVPLVGRETTNDVPLSKDKIIPKGFQIFIDIFNIQRDEDIWGPDAKTFNPDHLLPSNLEGKHKYAFMPFSKGMRNCIGWHYAGIALRVTLVQILRKYRLSTKFPYADLRFTQSITLGYEKVPNLEIHRR